MAESKSKVTPADKCYMIGKIFFDAKDYISISNISYRFNGSIWEEVGRERMSSLISDQYFNNYGACKTIDIKEVMRNIQDMTYLKYFSQIENISKKIYSKKINLKDGVFDLETLETTPYTKEDFCFSKLNFNYKKDYDCPIFLKFLKSSLDEEDPKEEKKIIQFFQEWIGYSLSAGNKLEKCLILVGDGGNGKGTLLHIWSKIVGEANISNCDVSDINNEQKMHMTKNKLLNISGDLKRGQQIDEGVMKRAISGEIVQTNPKYKTPEEFAYTAKNIIATNDLPQIKNTGNAASRRLMVFHFKKIISDLKIDRNLKKKLELELEDIFSFCVDGFLNLTERGEFDLPKRCIDSLEKYLKNNDVIEQWLDEDEVRSDKSCYELRTRAYRYYRNYAEQSKNTPMNKANFYEALQKKGIESKRNSLGQCFYGIKLPVAPC